jgi:hypothetical protein
LDLSRAPNEPRSIILSLTHPQRKRIPELYEVKRREVRQQEIDWIRYDRNRKDVDVVVVQQQQQRQQDGCFHDKLHATSDVVGFVGVSTAASFGKCEPS